MGEFTANGPNKDLGEAATGLQQHDTFSYWNGNVYIGPDGRNAAGLSGRRRGR